MPNITAKKIAEHLGLSQATVSIALNGKPGISLETRSQILSYAMEQGYDMSKVTSAQANGKNICYVLYINHLVSIAENTTFSSFVLNGVETAASRFGYNVMVRSFHTGEPFVEQIKSQLPSIDGFVLLGTDITDDSYEEVERFINKVKSVPIVIIDSPMSFGVADCICNDNFGGVRAAVNHLLERGCKDIGYIRSRKRIDNFIQREAGLTSALKDAGKKVSAVIDTEVSFDDAFQEIVNYIRKAKHLPDAFFAENDVIAAAAIRAFRANDIRIPKQVSIIGFDDIPICELTDPYLTTVHSYKEQLGEEAIKLLASKFNYYQPEVRRSSNGRLTISISTDLHIRKSVK